MYRTERNYENLNKGIFPGAGRFDIPILRPELTTAENWISFNYAKGCEGNIFHVTAFQEKLKARVKGKKETCNAQEDSA